MIYTGDSFKYTLSLSRFKLFENFCWLISYKLDATYQLPYANALKSKVGRFDVGNKHVTIKSGLKWSMLAHDNHNPIIHLIKDKEMASILSLNGYASYFLQVN